MKNRVEIEGRLGADAKTVSATGSKNVTRFTLAISKTWKKNGETHKRVDWIRVSCWEAGVVATAKDFKKGDIVEVLGELRTGQYESGDGIARNSFEVRASSVKVVSRHKKRRLTEDSLSVFQPIENNEDNGENEPHNYRTLTVGDQSCPAA
jgi:single stranded DNA-binding protein